jgi:hypothetical protein
MSRIFGIILLAIALARLGPPSARAQQTSANIPTGPVSARLKLMNTVVDSDAGSSNNANTNILYGTSALGDSRLFLVQQGTTSGSPDTPGKLIAINPNVVNSAQTTILNFDTALPGALDVTQNEKGLLGLAFHPNFNKPEMPGYLKFYTYTNEVRSYHAGLTGTPSGAPDYIHPELTSDPATLVNNIAVLREWTANSTTPTGVTGSSRIILKYADPQNQHNGGTIAFSPADGYLYWALGDGGGNSSNGPDSLNGLNNATDGHTNSPGGTAPHGNGQDRTVPFGKMLRIDPLRESDYDDPLATPSANGQYQIPNDNPFTMASNINPMTSAPYPNWSAGWLDEIYAYGLRNPYRWSFDQGASVDDPNRGKIYVNDVGYNDREEVDVIQPGGNYGWVIREGTRNMAGVSIALTPPVTFPTYAAPVNAQTGLPDTLIDPIAEYNHTVGVASVGGFVYRGWKESSLYGKYIFGDNAPKSTSFMLMYIDPDEAKAPNAPFTIHSLAISPLGASLPGSGLLGLGQGPDNSIYAMFDNGQVYAINPLFTADFDHDGDVDAGDLTTWKGAFGSSAAGDADGDGDSDGADFLVWQKQLGSGVPALAANAGVPEPTAGLLLLIGCAALASRRPSRR